MSIESTIQRVATINAALANPSILVQGAASTAETGGTAAPSSSTGEAASAPSFADALEQASLATTGSDGSLATTGTNASLTTTPMEGGLAKTDSEGSITNAETSTLVAALEQNGLTAADGESHVSPASLDTDLGASSGSASVPASVDSASGYGVASSGAYGVPGSASGHRLPSSGSADGTGSLAATDGTAGAGAASADTIGQRIVAIAESQAGQTEEPPGSNESPTISMYRSATAGAIPGAPWCAYFASWAAKQAGEPIGSEGQGLGAVSEIWSWAQSTGRAIENGPGVVPKPGDLIVFGDEHVGIVRGVLPDGQIETIEGNYENKVALNVRSPSEPTGYVEMS